MGPIFPLRARHIATVVILAIALPCAPAQAEFFDGQPAVPTVAPIPSQQSRKSGQDMATALAIGGAVFAGGMCAVMMKKAQETEDQTQKMMLMMMAMQECKQATDSLANAAKNQDGSDTMTQPAAAPAQAAAAATSAPFQLPTNANLAPTQAVAAQDTPALPTFSPLAMPSPIQTSGVVADTAFDNNTPLTSNTPGTKGTPVDATTDLAAMPQAKVGFDETSSASNGTSTVGTGAGLMAAIGTSGSANASGTPAPDAKLGDDKNGGRAAGKTADAGDGASGGGTAAGGANGKTPDNFDSLLAGLMGHGADGGTMNLGNTSGGLAVGGAGRAGAPGEALPNIFEYATFRFREMVDEEKLLFDGSIASHREKRTNHAVAQNAAPKKPVRDEPARGNRAPASVVASAPAAPAARPAPAPANSMNKSQAQIDARMVSKVRMAGGLR